MKLTKIEIKKENITTNGRGKLFMNKTRDKVKLEKKITIITSAFKIFSLFIIFIPSDSMH